MLYSMAPVTFLIINHILNFENFKKHGLKPGKQDLKYRMPILYNYFILAANIYFFVDATWGIMISLRFFRSYTRLRSFISCLCY